MTGNSFPSAHHSEPKRNARRQVHSNPRIAWKTRHALALDYVPAGVSPAKDDNIVYLDKAEQANGFKHPMCGGTEDKVTLPPVRKQ